MRNKKVPGNKGLVKGLGFEMSVKSAWPVLRYGHLAKARACSSGDRASGSGPEGRRFDSCHARKEQLE